MKKLRCREFKWLVQVHRAKTWQSWDLNLMEGLSTWFALLWNKFMVFNDPSSSSLCSHQGQSSTSDRFQAFTSVTVWIVSVLQTNPAFSNLCFVVQALPSEWPYFPLPLALDLKYQQHPALPQCISRLFWEAFLGSSSFSTPRTPSLYFPVGTHGSLNCVCVYLSSKSISSLSAGTLFSLSLDLLSNEHSALHTIIGLWMLIAVNWKNSFLACLIISQEIIMLSLLTWATLPQNSWTHCVQVTLLTSAHFFFIPPSAVISLSLMLSHLICVMLANCSFGLYIRTEFHWISIIS